MQTQDALALMLILTKSTARYVHKRLEKNGKYRGAYTCAMTQSITELKNCIEDDRTIMYTRSRVEGIKIFADNVYPKHWYKSNEECRGYYNMAIDQVLEIIDSLDSRFITGGCDTDPRMFRGRGLHIYEDESVFE